VHHSPFKTHNDPPSGLYFYPIDWLLNDSSERLLSGNQWGSDWPYVFIAGIDTGSDGEVLSRTTWADVERIARRNSWWEWMEWWRGLGPEEQKATHAFPYYTNPEKPGDFLRRRNSLRIMRRI
jgi:hypothetical protein